MQDYGAINAKIGAMKACLLKEDNYLELANAKSVDEAARLLASAGSYGRALSLSAPLSSMRRAAVERKLFLSLADDFTRILHFINDRGLKSYFSAFFLRMDVRMLKNILSSINDRRDTAYSLSELKSLFSHKLELDLPRLVRSKSIGEFIENLKGTEFYAPLSKKRGEETGVTELELALDMFYYVKLWKLPGAESGMDRVNAGVLRSIHGAEIDLQNIISAYRLKTHYNTPANSIYPYLIPINHRLDKNALARITEAETYGDLRREIMASAYGKIFEDKLAEDGGERGTGAKGVDGCFYAGMRAAYRRMSAEKPDSIARTAAYLFEKELEIKNIVSLLEGVRYGISAEETMSFLIV